MIEVNLQENLRSAEWILEKYRMNTREKLKKV